jgi:hypothetical protein
VRLGRQSGTQVCVIRVLAKKLGSLDQLLEELMLENGADQPIL